MPFEKKQIFQEEQRIISAIVKLVVSIFFDSAMDVIIKRRQPAVYCALPASRYGYAVAVTT